MTLECCRCNREMNRIADSELVSSIANGTRWPPIRRCPTNQGFHRDARGQSWNRYLRRRNPRPLEARVACSDGIHCACDPRADTLQGDSAVIHPGKINLATLHSAHLLFFREFAYGYLCTPVGLYIQNLLKNPDLLGDHPFVSLEIPRSAPVDPGILYRVGICTLAGKERLLFASLPVADPRSLCQLVLLPGFWAADVAAYPSICAAYADTWIDGNYRTIDCGVRQRLTAPEYAACIRYHWRGWTQYEIDCAMTMHAIFAVVGDSTVKKANAALIAARFGMHGEYWDCCIRTLVENGYLVRARKRRLPYLVRLTEKALTKLKRESRTGKERVGT